MTKYTQRQLKAMIKDGIAEDVTKATNETRKQIEEVEGYYTQVGFSSGVYGCNGMLLKGAKTGKLYAVTDRTTAIYIF